MDSSDERVARSGARRPRLLGSRPSIRWGECVPHGLERSRDMPLCEREAIDRSNAAQVNERVRQHRARVEADMARMREGMSEGTARQRGLDEGTALKVCSRCACETVSDERQAEWVLRDGEWWCINCKDALDADCTEQTHDASPRLENNASPRVVTNRPRPPMIRLEIPVGGVLLTRD